jgi:hypothetical protein
LRRMLLQKLCPFTRALGLFSQKYAPSPSQS